MEDSTVRLQLTGDFEITIGNDPGSQVVLPITESVNARLRRAGDRLFLKTARTDGARTLINHVPIQADRWTEVTRYDEIVIADTVLSVSPKFFLGRDRVGLDTTALRYVLPGRSGRILVDGLYLRAKPGTLTAIIGPAGSGKTLFLSMLNGYLAPTEGRISIADNFDPHKDYSLLRDFIGYVPQDDIMIPELTVRQSLAYRLSLKFPDMLAVTRRRLIRETCHQLGLGSERIDLFLDTVIGSPDSHRRGLSGGERKRANIAHELITRPLILILDEPTSGLSSNDADQVIRLISRLAKEDLLTVIASVHQPGPTAYELFDDLMILGYGGKLNYYGPAELAVDFFETATQTQCRGSSPSEYFLDQISIARHSDKLPLQFRKMRETLPRIPVPLNDSQITEPPPSAAQRPKGNSSAEKFPQWVALVRRNLTVLCADKASLALSLFQAPLIALMIFAIFHGAVNDTGEFDQLAKTKFYFDLAKARYESSGETIPEIERLWREAGKTAESDRVHIGVSSGSRLAAIYFSLIAASIWLGTLGACRDIVGEQHILKREIRTCVDLAPYLGSKIFVHLLLAGVQSGLLVLSTASLPLGLNSRNFAGLWAILWLVSAASASLGLLVSCLAPTQRVALTAIPILMIPQLLFGGILRPPAEINQAYLLPRVTSMATIQYWGFQAALDIASAGEKKVLKEETNLDTFGRYSELNIVKFTESSLATLYFPPHSSKIAGPVPILFLGAGFFLFLAYLALKFRFS